MQLQKLFALVNRTTRCEFIGNYENDEQLNELIRQKSPNSRIGMGDNQTDRCFIDKNGFEVDYKRNYIEYHAEWSFIKVLSSCSDNEKRRIIKLSVDEVFLKWSVNNSESFISELIRINSNADSIENILNRLINLRLFIENHVGSEIYKTQQLPDDVKKYQAHLQMLLLGFSKQNKIPFMKKISF